VSPAVNEVAIYSTDIQMDYPAWNKDRAPGLGQRQGLERLHIRKDIAQLFLKDCPAGQENLIKH